MALYRILISLFALPALLRGGDISARLGRETPPAQARRIWLHGASNGELASFRPVLERLLQTRPDLHWLVTANTPTGRDMVAGWGLARVDARLAPLDLAWVNARVFRRWQVIAHISLEAELWPNRFLRCPGPVLLIGARISSGTARGWAKYAGRLAQKVLGRVAYASAQDAGSLDRLLGLGLNTTAKGPVLDLKAFYTKPEQTPDAMLRTAFDRTGTWLAASTHEGEDGVVLDAHARALRTAPDLKLILAPRHPARADDIQESAKERGLSVARRSRNDAPDAQVYLADTMGEMALWYALSGRVFIGGTLTDRGGHTPYEPASFGAALLHGPDVANFQASFGLLTDGAAAVEVTDAASLAQGLATLAAPDEQRRMGAEAQALLQPGTDIDAFVQDLAARLPA